MCVMGTNLPSKWADIQSKSEEGQIPSCSYNILQWFGKIILERGVTQRVSGVAWAILRITSVRIQEGTVSWTVYMGMTWTGLWAALLTIEFYKGPFSRRWNLLFFARLPSRSFTKSNTQFLGKKSAHSERGISFCETLAHIFFFCQELKNILFNWNYWGELDRQNGPD